jgi:hypothetical protein
MSKLTNEEIIKAPGDEIMVTGDLSTAGLLNPEQFKTFISLMVDQPTLLNDISIQTMKSHTTKLESLEYTGRVAFKATEGIAPTTDQVSKLAASKVELKANEIQAQTEVSFSFDEDNLAGVSVSDWIMQKLAARFALDVQELAVMADPLSGDDYLTTLTDGGLLKQAHTNTIDYSSSPKAVSDDVFNAALMAMPTRYRNDIAGLRILCHPNTEVAYNKWVSDRNNPGTVGDVRLIDGVQTTSYAGIKLFPVVAMPEDKIVLTHRNNIVLGIYRDITTYKLVWAPARMTYYGLTMRVDVKYREELGAVKVIGLNPRGTTTS